MKEKWNRFTKFCWWYFGASSFWPVLIAIAFSFSLVYNSLHRYTERDIQEIKSDIALDLEHARSDGFDEGYNEGYSEGWEVGCDASDSEHANDYDNGHQDGYAEGYSAAESKHEDDFSDGYDSGYSNGYRDGFNDASVDPSNYRDSSSSDALISKDKFLAGVNR